MRNALLLVVALTSCVAAFAAEGDGAVALWVRGEAQASRPGSEAWEPLEAGVVIPQGTAIATGADSACAVALEGAHSESAVLLDAGTTAYLSDLGTDGRVKLEQGTIFTKLAKRKGSTFQVDSPTGIAAARGTGWSQSADIVEVYEGSIDLRAHSGQTEVLMAGEGIDVLPGGVLAQKRSVAASGKEAWEAFVSEAGSSPFFGRIRAQDILDIREAVDAKRSSIACGETPGFTWSGGVESGAAISMVQIQELKDVLSEPPFLQSETFVSAYLDPIPDLTGSEPIRISHIRLIEDTVENASC